MKMRLLLMTAGLAVGLPAARPRPARACGGFFCDRPTASAPLPIAQSAENVLFVMDTDPATGARRVEAHIQILYTGPAAKFSWIVPVTSTPTVDVGSNILFDRIEPPTRPSFQVRYQMEGNCKDTGGGAGCIAIGGSSSSTAVKGGGGAGPAPTVEVESRGSVGPYDYVVVRSEDGATLRTWLTDNGYFVSDQAAKIVDDYVTGGHAFVAVKLQAGQDTSAIRPIILRLAAVEACLPLKLTAIAATPDLRINVWVLAGARAVPINYTEVGINQAKLDWFNFGRNYDQLLKEAANEANGNAFAVEYARAANLSVPWFTLVAAERVRLSSMTTPPDYVAALARTGGTITGEVLQIVKKHIPEPASLAAQGVSEASFYAGLAYYWDVNREQFAPFDPVGLTADLEANVFQPMDTLREQFNRAGMLTRLATFISPEEMNSDPLFVTNASLPEVVPAHTAVAHVLCGHEDFAACGAPVRLELEDRRDVMFRSIGCMQYDRGDLDRMPSADVAWRRSADDAGTVVLDNRPAAAELLAQHNAGVSTAVDSGCGCAMGGRSRVLLGWTMIAFTLLALRARRRMR